MTGMMQYRRLSLNIGVGQQKKEHKPKLLGPDIFRGVGIFHMKGWWPKSPRMSLETRETKLSGRDIQGFCRDIPAVPEKLEKIKSVLNLLALVGLS